MVFEYATRRDKNGNRLYLGINNDNFTFSRQRGKWYSRDDIIEISKKDRRKLIEQLERAGYTEIEYFNGRRGQCSN